MADFEAIKKPDFSTPDYIVMALLLVFSAAIGVYYAIKTRKSTSTQEYLMAGRNMNPIPVALSILSSFMSAVSLLGTPSEIYTTGTQFTLIVFSFLMVVAVAGHIYVPVFFSINATSSFEYLELRFGKKVRLAGSLTMTLQMVLYMAIVLYAPSLALNAVTGLSIPLSVLLIGCVCTFYTTIGGMKAVMWTDAFQITLMFTSVIILIVEGYSIVGRETVIQRSEWGQRIEFFNFNPNPLERHTVWTIVIGGFFTWLAVYGVNQSQIQRCLTVSTLKKAQIALWINGLGLFALYSILSVAGLLMFGYYYGCDPLEKEKIKPDQLIPFFVMDILEKYPGVPGLFVSGLFSGTLSTLSSGVNSLATIVLEDIMKPYICKSLTDLQAMRLSKLLALIFGAVVIGLAFLAGEVGSILLQAAFSIFGMIGGPILGVFTLGMLFPWANAKGALVGLFTGLIITLWVGVGATIYRPPTKFLPLSLECCNNNTGSNMSYYSIDESCQNLMNLSVVNKTTVYKDVLPIYNLSYLWYSGFSVLLVLIIGHLVTFCTGKTNSSDLDARLIFPLFYKLTFFLPSKYRQKLLFGIKYNGEYGVYSKEVTHSLSNGGNINAGYEGVYTLSYAKSGIDANDHVINDKPIHINGKYKPPQELSPF